MQAGEKYPPILAAGESRVAIPIGWYDFCKNPIAWQFDCSSNDPAASIPTNKKNLQVLEQVNQSVNTGVRPMTDYDHYGRDEVWAYPADGFGDCEDYVLEKRRELAEAGFPYSDLLITVVSQVDGSGHAVLMVRTNRGDYILDNLSPEVLLWYETPYRFLKRQATNGDPNYWVELKDPRSLATVASIE